MAGVLALQKLLAEHVAEEDADQVDAPQVLQLLGEEGHRLVQAGGRAHSGKVSSWQEEPCPASPPASTHSPSSALKRTFGLP